MLEQLVNVQRRELRGARGTEQRRRQADQAVRFAHDEAGVVTLGRRFQLALEQLRRAADPAQGITQLVGQLAHHAPTGLQL